MNWVREIANWTIIVWLLAAMVISMTSLFRMLSASKTKPDNWLYRIVRTVFWELRPFYLPAVVVKAALAMVGGDFDGIDALAFVLNLVNWVLLKDPRDDDDDRWKRRRTKAAEKVRVSGSRLVLAPVGAS